MGRELTVGRGKAEKHTVWVSFGQFGVNGVSSQEFPFESHAESAREKLQEVFEAMKLCQKNSRTVT